MSKMEGDFREVVSASMEWTKTVLLRPFKFKKWLMLYVIALLAFQMQGGCNINFSDSPRKDDTKTERTKKTQDTEVKSDNAQEGSPKETENNLNPRMFLIQALLIGAVVLVLLTAWEWLYSIFSFIFIQAIASNDASIKRPFLTNRPLGNSYFVLNMIYIVVFFGILAILVKLGYDALFRLGIFEKGSNVAFGRIALAILPHALTGILVLLVSALFSFFISDYVLVVMYKDRIGISKAIGQAFSLFCSDFGASVKYLFVKIGLWIAIAVISSALSLLMVISLVGPVVVLGLILSVLYRAMHSPIQPIYVIVLLILGIPLIVVFASLANLIFLPFSIFLKTFNLKFISRIDKRYNLFRLS